jgi:hypothetical protein
MFRRRGRSCRRLARGGRLSLHSTDAGKSDYKDESKNSFSHGGERNQTAGLQSTHFQRANLFFAQKTASDHSFALPAAPRMASLGGAQNLGVVTALAFDSESSAKDESV